MNKFLLVLTDHLGNKVYNETIIKLLSYMKVDFEAIYIERNENPLNIPIINRLHCSYIVFLKYLKLKKKFDIILFHGFELPYFFNWVKSKKILTLDATADASAIINYQHMNKPIRGAILSYLYKRLYRPMIKKIDFFITRSTWCTDELRTNYKVNKEKVINSPNYLDLTIWKPIPEGKKFKNTALLVGNNLKSKGGEFLIELFSSRLTKYNLILVTNDCKEYKLKPNIKILKGLSRDSLIEIYQKSNVFLFPSFFDKFGLVLTEAMACGLPVIVRDIGGGASLVKNKNNGVVLPGYSTASEWEVAIINMFEETDNRIKMGINARIYAEENFSFEKNIDILKLAIKKCRS